MNLIKYKLFFYAGLLLVNGVIKAQGNAIDTVAITYADAQQLFIKNNFILLAQKYNIDIAKAAKQQAGLWANPTVFAELNAYNPHNLKWFNTDRYVDPATGATNYGSYNFQINQLVQTAGKRNKAVAIAETNVQLQQQAFEELMRQMRLDMFNAYSNLYFNQQAFNLLNTEEKRIEELVRIEKFALSKGAASGYEITRLQFELQDLQTDINTYLNAIADAEMQLNIFFCNKTITYYSANALPLLNDKDISVTQLTDSAIRNRPDIKIARYTIDQNKINLKLQKANNVPDLVFGATYDRNGGAYLNYTGLNISLPVPLFNRNQGNIKVAKLSTQLAETNKQITDISVEQDIYNSYQKYLNTLLLQKQIQPEYESSLQNISQQAVENYNKRTISLLDFIDKTRTYRDAKLNLLQLQNNLLQSKQYINYACNSNIF